MDPDAAAPSFKQVVPRTRKERAAFAAVRGEGAHRRGERLEGQPTAAVHGGLCGVGGRVLAEALEEETLRERALRLARRGGQLYYALLDIVRFDASGVSYSTRQAPLASRSTSS